MDSGEIVIHEVQGDLIGVVLDFLREGVGEAGKAAHRHTHREVLAFNVAG